jgi:hypothetical protein
LAKRNYGFEKRQKEIARKAKQDDKRQRRLERPQDSPDELPPEASGVTETEQNPPD